LSYYSFSLSLLLSALILFPSNNLKAQLTSLQLNGKSYEFQNGNWYSIDQITNEKFKVNTGSMTVKLSNEDDENKLKELCSKFDITIENVNILGYYDLVLPEDSKFYEMFAKFKESRLFYSIEITSYGKLLGSNDPGYSDQYYLDNSNNFPDINIGTAWAIEHGSPSVIIAVIDEGVDNDNTDIDANIWDGYGWDYIGNDSNPDPEYSEEHHGTSVAGIIAAESNNSSAVAGIAGGWNGPGCKIMSLRVFGYEYDEEEWEYNIASVKIDDAIIFAANNGAKIINMSFALDGLTDFQNIVTSVDAALEYAYKQKGCLLVAASGNNPNKEGIYYPARNPNVMAIGGLYKDWGSYGRYGTELEIVAPADHIYTLLTSNPQNQDRWGYFDNTTYGRGTSASSPQTAGVAALIFSKYPNWINYDVRKILNESAFDLGNQLKFGNGLFQADEAMDQADPNYQVDNNQPQNVTLSGAYGSNPIITWDEVTSDYIDRYNIYRAQIVDGIYSHFIKVDEVIDVGNSTYNWTDTQVIRVDPKFATSTHFYRVTSVNDEEVESVTSNEVSTGSNWASKKADVENEQVFTFKYNLGDNYPNPFNPSTKIRYSLKEKGLVSITVYDILGRVVDNLVNETQTKGNHEVVFNTGENLSSGIYFYTLNVNEFHNTKKLILAK